MIVSYPMYALPEMQHSLDLWWKEICRRLHLQDIDAPESLRQPGADLIAHWLSSELLLSQTCGFPLVSQLESQVKLVGTPMCSAQGCDGPNYCTFYIVQKNDPRTELKEYQGARFAYNSTDSQSGFNAVRMNLLEQDLPVPFFGTNSLSGAHRSSILIVAGDKADICAVDCVTYSLLKMHQPQVLENTRILGQTRHTPGLPFITSNGIDDQIVTTLFNTINEVSKDKSMQDINRDLQLTGLEKVDLDTYYRTISTPENPIEKL